MSNNDFSKTVNLPKTDFPMKAGLPQKEPVHVKKWETQQIYQKIRKKNEGKPKFVLHDGPPYANGHIHMGTSLNKILKDVIVKYKSMSGFDAPYTPGWDCHGLPIEQQLMKDLKTDKHGIDKVTFRKKAAEFANKFIDIQKDEFKRLGVFADWGNPYLTLKPGYESVIIKTFGELLKAGYIYRKKKPVYWCPTCETAMADAEVEYADHISHSVYVKFDVMKFTEKLTTELGNLISPEIASPAARNDFIARSETTKQSVVNNNIAVLIWTTTPWTLPANVALAFQPEADYCLAEIVFEDRTEKLILAKRLLPALVEKFKAKEYKVLKDISAKSLEGIICKNPLLDRTSVGVLAEYVTLDDGTGVVHIAPGHGQDDYQVGLKYKLDIISPVDDRGRFTEEVPEFKGQKVFMANTPIVEKLKNDGKLIMEDKLSHSYPHCWRCRKPIIFRATEQWFLSVEYKELRKRIFDTIKQVQWIPGYGENRINGMIESRPDWCLSRQRLWGVPVPVIYCEKCKQPLADEKLINRVAELVKQHGSDIWYEKSVEELFSDMDLKCSCGGTKFKKEEDILDVWFDSGVSSEAVLRSGEYDGLSWPADMYLEGSDQHRGWFQTSLIPAVALHDKAPYKTVLTHGFVVDGEGKKMSKSVGNTILPEQVYNQSGADIIRLWVSTSDYREDIKISKEILNGLGDTYRKIRNTIRYLIGNTSDYKLENKVAFEKLREIDRYALSRLHELIKTVTKAYETYEFHKAATALNNYCTVFLSGFYMDVLKDTMYCDKPEWDARKSAQTVLHETCSVLIRMLAPILSFTSEEAWQELKKTYPELADSVFLTEFPKANPGYELSEEINSKWDVLFKIREKALLELENLRKDKKIGSNLEAHLDVMVNDSSKLSNEYKELLCSVIGTWDIEVKKVSDPGSAETDPVIIAKPSEFHKCERCWRHMQDVSVNNVHNANLCSRCIKAL